MFHLPSPSLDQAPPEVLVTALVNVPQVGQGLDGCKQGVIPVSGWKLQQKNMI